MDTVWPRETIEGAAASRRAKSSCESTARSGASEPPRGVEQPTGPAVLSSRTHGSACSNRSS
jgi:hypothetical protein